MEKINFKELDRKKFTRAEFKLRLLSRVGVYFSWFFLSLGIPINIVTFGWILLKFIGVLMMASGNYLYSVIGIFLYNIIAPIMDNADGHMLRYKKQSSAIGIFMEAIGHILLIPLLYISLGVGVYIASGNLLFLLIGFTTALMFLLKEAVIKEAIPLISQKEEKPEKQKKYCYLLKIKKIISEWFETEYPVSIMFLGILFNLPALILALYFIIVAFSFLIKFFSICYSIAKARKK